MRPEVLIQLRVCEKEVASALFLGDFFSFFFFFNVLFDTAMKFNYYHSMIIIFIIIIKSLFPL